MIKRVPREYAELRIDLSRDALVELLSATAVCPECSDELQNLRNVVRNLVDRFDGRLTE